MEEDPTTVVRPGNMTDKQWAAHRRRHQAAFDRRVRQEKFLQIFAEVGGDKSAALARARISPRTYQLWRTESPEFKARLESIRANLAGRGLTRGDLADPGFAVFRKTYFKMDSPEFHLLAIDAYETTPPGNITLILWPPDHGKTTLAEDYSGYRLALDPDFRITVGSETRSMSMKVLRRVQHRMSPSGPFPDYVMRYGPFEPEGLDGLPWTATHFDVARKTTHDERDYSMVALGMGSQVAGTRTDHLHLDDVQSTKTIARTSQFVNTIRQDWLSRPGEYGRTVINGTRVDEGDVYEVLIDELPRDILRVIRLPAIVTETDPTTGEVTRRPLWSERYNLDQLDRMRAKVGEEAWARNYMQQPRARSTATFRIDTMEACGDPLASTVHYDPPEGSAVVVGLDPAIGGRNAIAGCEMGPSGVRLVDWRVDEGLTSYDQIFDLVRMMCVRMSRRGARITDLVIETMAFQKGLGDDRRLTELQNEFGFSFRSHQVGVNKYDENFGVPQIQTSFLRQEIVLPTCPDDETASRTRDLMAEFAAWRPHIKGSRLRQDLVMAFWFCWIIWKERRGMVEANPSSFDFAGAPGSRRGAGPWAMSSGGLVVPRNVA